MTKRLSLLFCLALISVGAAWSAAQPPPAPGTGGPKQAFRWRFPPQGESFTLETTTDLKQLLKVTNQEETRSEQKYQLRCSYTVLQQDADSSVLEQKVEKVAVLSPSGAAPGKFWQQLEGCTLKLTLNKNFQLTRMEGYEELVKKVAGDDPNVRRVIQALLSEEAVRRSIEESFAFLPQEEIAPGQSWERKWTASLGPLGNLAIVNVYTFERVETDAAGMPLQRIGVKPQISYGPPKADSAGLPFQIPSGELRAVEAAGTLWWNAAEGKLARSDMRLHLVGKLKIKASKDQEATLTLDSDQTVEIKLVKPTNQ